MKQRCTIACCGSIAGLWLVLLVGCALDPPTVPQTTVPITPPVAVATPRVTASAASISTATPPIAPTPTATPAGPGMSTPAPPTPSSSVLPSASPLARSDESYCQRPFGPASVARFSARLRDVEVHAVDKRTEVVLQFDDVQGALHGAAACRWAGTWPQTNDLGAVSAPGPAFIALDLPDWAHDEAFRASVLTDTLPVGAATAADAQFPAQDGNAAPQSKIPNAQRAPESKIALAANSLDSRGALLGIGLPEPRPFAVRVEDDRVIVSIANDDASVAPASDPLGTAQGTLQLDGELFFLQDETVFRLDARGAQPVSTTLAAITGLTVDGTGSRLAVCAPSNNLDRTALWVMDVDGSNERVLAEVGGCAEPAFNPSGDTIAFVGPESDTEDGVSAVWTVPATGGEATLVRASFDQWTRSTPRWLDRHRLLYRATNEEGTSMLLLNENGVEREVSARLLTGTAYRGVGRFVVDPQADMIAVEALHANDDGSDLVIVRGDGSVVATEQRGWQQQPLGFTTRGLLYLTIECPSSTVQPYALRRRTPSGTIETLLAGSTTYTIGAAMVQRDTLLYVRAPIQEDAAQKNEVWLLADGGTTRTPVRRSQTP